MDSILLLLEPQIAIPVVGVVVCAVLVYIFGFQQTQEPSFQHLAILQSSGKSKASNGVTSKPSKPAPSPRTTSKAKEKPVSNGNVVQGSSGKENVKPQQQPTTPKAKKEKNQGAGAAQQVDDAGEGDWIQAVSRKDKKKVVKKEENKPAASDKAEAEDKAARLSPPPANKPRPILEEIALRAKLEQNTNVETKKEEEKKKAPPKEVKAVKAELKVQEVLAVVNKKDEPKKKEAPKPAAENAEPKQNEVPKPAAAAEPKKNEEPKSNVAFDEVGDLWKEAKSRGAKKNRVRKD